MAEGGAGSGASAMRAAIWAQPAELRRLLADPEPARAAAGKLRNVSMSGFNRAKYLVKHTPALFHVAQKLRSALR